jgi:hypothetical protein
MSEAASASSPSISRFWAFVGAAFLIGPMISYLFSFLSQTPVMFSVVVVAVVLAVISVAFGLWGRAFSAFIKVGTVCWILVLAFGSPIILVVVLSLGCAVQNGMAGHYVCGI